MPTLCFNTIHIEDTEEEEEEERKNSKNKKGNAATTVNVHVHADYTWGLQFSRFSNEHSRI